MQTLAATRLSAARKPLGHLVPLGILAADLVWWGVGLPFLP